MLILSIFFCCPNYIHYPIRGQWTLFIAASPSSSGQQGFLERLRSLLAGIRSLFVFEPVPVDQSSWIVFDIPIAMQALRIA